MYRRYSPLRSSKASHRVGQKVLVSVGVDCVYAGGYFEMFHGQGQRSRSRSKDDHRMIWDTKLLFCSCRFDVINVYDESW